MNIISFKQILNSTAVSYTHLDVYKRQGLYYAVGHWNDFYTALLYLYDTKLMPLQSFLRDMLMSNKLTMNSTTGMDAAAVEAKMKLAQTLKYSAIIVSTIPVLCIYPFIQKHFVKGIMIGSVKG